MDSVNVAIVRQAYEDYKENQVDKVVATLTDDVSWRVIGQRNAMAPFGDWKGPDGARDYFERLKETIDTKQFLPQQFVSEGDTVVVTGRTLGTMRASRQPIEVEWVHVFRITDGKISEYREFFDTALVLSAARVPEPA